MVGVAESKLAGSKAALGVFPKIVKVFLSKMAVFKLGKVPTLA